MRGREYLHGGGRDAVGRDNSPDDGWGSHLESAAERHECSLWRVVRGREYRHRGGRQRDDSPDHGRGGHLDPSILRTTDGGCTCTRQTVGAPGSGSRGVSCVDANTCTAVGDFGTILRT